MKQYVLLLVCFCTIATHGMQNNPAQTGIANSISAAAKKAGQSIAAASSYVWTAIANRTRAASNAVTAKYQGMIDDQRVKAVQTYINTELNAHLTYIKAHPIQTSLLTIGAGTVACASYQATKTLHHAVQRYCARNTSMCNCCQHVIKKKTPKHLDPTMDAATGTFWICEPCYRHLCLGPIPCETPSSE